MSVYVHLAEGFEEIEAITVLDVLKRAEIPVTAVSVSGGKLVKGAHGIPVEADILYDEVDYEECEMIVLPGGLPGTTNLGAHEGLVKHIRCFADSGKWLAAICAAPMVLAEQGALQGKSATICPGMEDKLKAGGAVLREKNAVTDGKVVTGRAPGAAMDFALELVKQLAGEERAGEVAAAMVYQR